MSQRRSTCAGAAKAAIEEEWRERKRLIAVREQKMEEKWGRDALLAAREERKRIAKKKAPPNARDQLPPRPSNRTKLAAARGNMESRRQGTGRLTKRSLFIICIFSTVLPFLLLQSKTTTQSSFRAAKKPKKVHMMQASEVEENDLFSASWLQPVSIFLDMDTSGDVLMTSDAGSYTVFEKNRENVRMTLDWLDLSVEHLSDWIDTMDIFTIDDNIPFHVIISKLHEFIQNNWVEKSNTSMQDTIGVIAFEPTLENRKKPELAMELSATLLAATMASLLQANFGRVIVVGYKNDDAELADEAFRLLLTLAPVRGTKRKIGSTEFGFVKATTEDVISKMTPINIVKGSLIGLQHALKGELEKWLGNSRERSSWNYVYLTEPDTILQTKPSALPQLKAALDEGTVLAPHRIQPVPHEYDLLRMTNPNKFIPAKGNFSSVLELNPLEGAVCCDELSKSYKPWKEYLNYCSTLWWQCGFNDKQDHSRLEPYALMKLKPGMNVVNLAANHNGRRCKPIVNGVCKPAK